MDTIRTTPTAVRQVQMIAFDKHAHHLLTAALNA